MITNPFYRQLKDRYSDVSIAFFNISETGETVIRMTSQKIKIAQDLIPMVLNEENFENAINICDKLYAEVKQENIESEMDNRRPCIVKAKKSGPKEYRTDRKAYFCSSFYTSNGGGQMLMLVEFEDGHCEQIQPKNIIFTDGGGFDGWFDAREAKEPESLGKSSEETSGT